MIRTFHTKRDGAVYYRSAPYAEMAEADGMKICKAKQETCQVIYSNCSLPEAVPIH